MFPLGLRAAKFLTPMRREGEEALSIKSLNAQIDSMMQATHLLEDEASRIQFMERIEVVQRDLHCLRSELERNMPRNLKQPSTLSIDHALRLIGSQEEGYMPLTKRIWQKVQDITQRIDCLSEGLAFVVQRRGNSRHLQASRSDEDLYLHSDSDDPSDDPDPYVQDDIEQMIYSRGTVDGLRNYSFDYSQLNSDGHQVQISFSHARVHYYPSSNSQTSGQHNQFTRGPNRFNSQSTSSNVYPYDRSSISSSYHLGASRGHSHGYFTEYPSDRLSHFPEGRYPYHTGPSSSNMPRPPGPSFWRIPSDTSNFGNSLIEYPRNYRRTDARHGDIIPYGKY